MGLLDLIEWLDRTNNSWRDGILTDVDLDMVEELLYVFLRRNQSWLDDLVPPCMDSRLEWVMALFSSEGPAVKEAVWSIFGYCQKAIIDDLIEREAMELAYE